MSALRLGVLGAGTMGSGIAALGAEAGFETVLCDVDPGSLAAGMERIGEAPVAATEDVEELGGCDLIVEAVPEILELKRELLEKLARLAPAATIASNTSSLRISSLAEGSSAPERIVGLHFFNPPTRMKLVELVRGPRTGEEALGRARGAAEAMGKTVIEVADGPGFLVNRCARPFYLEAMRIVEDGVATPPQVDRVCRLAGFPMGPFELADLVGVDVGLAVTEAMWKQSHGEPRWRPSPLQVDLVAAGRLGRKSGGGFRSADDEPPAPPAGKVPATVAIEGRDPLAQRLRVAATAVGIRLAPEQGEEPELRICTRPGVPRAGGAPLALACGEAGPLVRRDLGACAFSCLPPLGDPPLVELASGPWTEPAAAQRSTAFFGAIGFEVVAVRDAPGLVLARIVAQLVNEAAFAVAAGVAPAEDVDRALEIGLRHPRGPHAWAEEIGPARIVALLDQLRREDGDPRYRVAPALRRAALVSG